MPQDLRASVEHRRVERSRLLKSDRAHRGQFFTPSAAADLIVSMVDLPNEGDVRLLDPGAGVGSLTAALAARLADQAPDVRLRATGIENDPALAEDLASTFEECGSVQPGTYETVVADFVPWAAEQIAAGRKFDLVILNPPYRKITKSSPEHSAFLAAGVQTTNLYAGFVTLALRLLALDGQLVAITPRSFANGAYFRAFRAELLERATLQRIHVFDRRDQVFKDAEVLQENLIFSCRSGAPRGRVKISTSDGFIDKPRFHEVDYAAVVQDGDPKQFVHIATSAQGLATAVEMAGQPHTLADLELEVMTGRVVDFRAKAYLADELIDASTQVPLVYPGHASPAGLRWPGGATRKPSAIARNAETEWSLVPRGTYVIVKRFSAKEEPRRVVACLVRSTDLPGDVWGFENHLNVFHVRGSGMDERQAEALVAYLNSDLVDDFMRLFNGHTQINAGDLRSIRYPELNGLVSQGVAQ